MTTFFLRFFRPRKHVGGDEKHTSDVSNSSSGRPNKGHPWHRFRSFYHRNRKTNITTSSSRNGKQSTPCRQPDQHECGICKKQERARLKRELLKIESQIQKDLEKERTERGNLERNSLERELVDEEHFEWDHLEPMGPEASATRRSYSDPISPTASALQSPYNLQHKQHSQPLHDLYLQSKPLPLLPGPRFASSRPNRTPPPDTLRASELYQRPLIDLANISDLPLDTDAQPHMPEQTREAPKERALRPDATVPTLSPTFANSQKPIFNDISYLDELIDTRDPGTRESETQDRTAVSPTLADRESLKRSIASKSEGISPWAMFEEATKHDGIFYQASATDRGF